MNKGVEQMTKKERKDFLEVRDQLKEELQFPKELNALDLVAVTLKVQQRFLELAEKEAATK